MRILHKLVFILMIVSLFGVLQGFSTSNNGGHDLVSGQSSQDPVVTIRNSVLDLDGNIIVSGHTEQGDVFLSKITSDGNILWELVIGGENHDQLEDVKVDRQNDVVLIGQTTSSQFFIENQQIEGSLSGGVDIFLVKISSDGILEWGTYYGGSDDDKLIVGDDSIFVDSENNLIFHGYTKSHDLILDNSIQSTNKGGDLNPENIKDQFFDLSMIDSDLFIAKFTEGGDLIWGTYLGGSNYEYGEILLDRNDNIIAHGVTGSDNFLSEANVIRKGPARIVDQLNSDTYAVKISKTGSFVWGYLIGGNGTDMHLKTAIDASNNVFLMGRTFSWDWPASPDSVQPSFGGDFTEDFDLSIMKISEAGIIEWSTYYGGSGADDGNGYILPGNDDGAVLTMEARMYVDGNNDLIVLTQTDSTDLNVTENAITASYPVAEFQRLPYLFKINNEGELIFSTYLTGTGFTVATFELTDDLNNIYVAGTTDAEDFPTMNSFQSTNGGLRDVYLTKFDLGGNVQWSSYFGGMGSEFLTATIFDENQDIILVGETNSPDLPGINPDNAFVGGFDTFITKIDSTGNRLWTQYFGGSSNEEINKFSLLSGDGVGIYILGITTSNERFPDSTFSQAGFVANYDSDGNLNWAHSLTPEARVQLSTNANTQLFVVLLGTIVVVGAGSYFIGNYLRTRRIDDLLINEQMDKILSPIFRNHSSLIHIFAAQKALDSSDLGEIHEEIPAEIFDFKYLLNPVRLSIIKLLDESSRLTTVQIKEALGLGWREVRTHMESLQKNKYIIVEPLFVDGAIKSVVTADPGILSQYTSLKEVLLQFLDAAPNFEKYIEVAASVKEQSVKDELYPDE